MRKELTPTDFYVGNQINRNREVTSKDSPHNSYEYKILLL